MQSIILYSSKHGATLQCAEMIRQCAPGDTVLHDLDAAGLRMDLGPYDAVILGASVYMGRPRKAIRTYAKENAHALLEKRLGLFLCCIQDQPDAFQAQLELAYPKELIAHAKIAMHMGGLVDFSKLGFFDRQIMRMIVGESRKDKNDHGTLSTLSGDKAIRFCESLYA